MIAPHPRGGLSVKLTALSPVATRAEGDEMKRWIEYEVDEEDVREYLAGMELSALLDLFEWAIIGEVREVDGEVWDKQHHRPTDEAKAAVILKILE
jgi:hypothetical protein